MKNLNQLLTLFCMITVFSLSQNVAWAAGEEEGDSGTSSAKTGCENLSAEQLQDPEACYALIKKDLDPKSTQGLVFDPNFIQDTGNCSWCHFSNRPLSSDTNHNTFGGPGERSAIPDSLSPTGGGANDGQQ